MHGTFLYNTFDISIHALRGEGDESICEAIAVKRVFQSTPSVGRATLGFSYLRRHTVISIHALRGEGDILLNRSLKHYYRFQSTPSVGRATAKIYKYTILRLYIVYIKLYIFATAVLFT